MQARSAVLRKLKNYMNALNLYLRRTKMIEYIFHGQRLDNGEIVESKSIINENGLVYLKHPSKQGQWIGIKPETLEFLID